MNESMPRFEALIEAHHDELYRYIWRMLNTANRSDAPEEAGDLTQETFVRAYRAYPRLRADSNIRAWLYKIATNCVYSAFKRDKRRFATALPLLDEHDSILEDVSLAPDMQFLAGEAMDTIREAIVELPDKQRAALLMRYVQEMDYGEVAEALNCSEDSARANVYQAIKHLRVRLVDKSSQEVM
jgi:RNA polymerase sigma-70 factor (ECF subfamily)